MKYLMDYGRTGLELELPDHWDVTVIGKKPMPALKDPAAAMVEALMRPVGSKRLAEEAEGHSSACILICDVTRPVPNGLILPVVIRELLQAGLDAQQITVMVATGLHRHNEGAELRDVVGDDWVLETVKVVNHFARNDADHVSLGLTSRGTPIKLDRRFVEADLRLITGLVEPHFMAGYSGGRKLIVPGVAHADTITRLHAATFLESPSAANCILDGNPLHEEQLEIVRLIGGALGVNTVINEFRQTCFVNFGDVIESHHVAVDFMKKYGEIVMPRRFGTVITSSAGYPLDKTYYQTIKGMVGPMDILEPDGDLFIVSECSEGMGSPDYVEAQRRLVAVGPTKFLEELRPKGNAAIDEWQTEMQLKPMRIGTIRLFTQALKEQDRELTGVETFTDLDRFRQAIRKSVERSADSAVAIIPEGPYVIPLFHGDGKGPVSP
ncbi:MAG TPA: nickel-dependent lactate racemase [Desulfomonilaceae bacterium]|nr:nickel-dependent lactate racemase [Desulfomonilaceae bacterium]